MDENVTEDIIRPTLATHKSIPLAYMAKPALMQSAIHYLTGYDFRQQHPYQANGVTDDARQSAFALLNTCLAEMCCATGTQTYHGALVPADKVLAEVSRASNGCEEIGAVCGGCAGHIPASHLNAESEEPAAVHEIALVDKFCHLQTQRHQRYHRAIQGDCKCLWSTLT